MTVMYVQQEYVAATAGSIKSCKTANSSQQQQPMPDTSPGNSGSMSNREAASIRAEEAHRQQALLNQLKEVPVKGMNASLLVAPLLDHGRVSNSM